MSQCEFDITIDPITEEIQTDCFDFGNGSIMNRLRNAYYLEVMRLASVKSIKIQENTVVVYYIVLLTSMRSADDSDGHEYAAIKLDTICIDKSFQGKYIGTTVLQYIISTAKQFSDFAGCRFLILDALKEKYEWYVNNGFLIVDESTLTDSKPTVEMFIDFRSKDLYEEFCNP